MSVNPLCTLSFFSYLVPRKLLQVHEDAHELGDGQGGVGVVQLDGHLAPQNTVFTEDAGNKPTIQSFHSTWRFIRRRNYNDVAIPIKNIILRNR